MSARTSFISFTAVVVAVLALLVLIPTTAYACDGCRPWSSGCTRKSGQIDTRFAVDLPTPQSKDGVTYTYLSYAFCARVDHMQNFQLQSSMSLVALYNNTNNNTYSYLPTNGHLWSYGAGSESNPFVPNNESDARIMIYQGESPACEVNGVRGPAAVTMLIYNVTLSDGKYSYDRSNPVGVGFQATCDETETCVMDPSLKCIGRKGHMNCAVCLDKNNPRDAVNHDLSIFTTYYGSDDRGKAMLSGSSNPLNFRVFAMGNAYNSVSGDMSSLSKSASNANPFASVDSMDWSGIKKISGE
eukprot:PhM_4_TR5801/c0_g1_i2/m.90282